MRVTLVARTAFNSEVAHDLTDGWQGSEKDTDAALLTEFGGRACYQSWSKPNQATAENFAYIEHILDVGHHSVLEHGSLTFYIEGVSRSLTHELIRHRHLSPSQESQRYVKLGPDTRPVIPPLYQTIWEDDQLEPISETQAIVEEVWDNAIVAYDKLVCAWEERFRITAPGGRLTTGMAKKAREAARCVLPNMTPTRIVVSGNHRSWRHFLELRGSLGADAEIRQLAIEIYWWAVGVEPALYQGMTVKAHPEEGNYLEFAVNA